MTQQPSSSSASHALAEKPAFAVVEKDESTKVPFEPVPDADLHEIIRETAYALYEARGSVHGHALDDWLEAEAQVAQARAKAEPTSVAARR